jgi:hypothetical protein
MTDDTPRPPHGYRLSLYDELRRDTRALYGEIAWHRHQIAEHSRALSTARALLVSAERTLAWMRAHQADEIAELEAARARVKALLAGTRGLRRTGGER